MMEELLENSHPRVLGICFGVVDGGVIVCQATAGAARVKNVKCGRIQPFQIQ